MMLRIRGPFSAVICFLSLLEAMHWCLSASGDVNCSGFYVREVDNFRLFQSSFLSSGDNVVRLAAEMVERDTGRKHAPDDYGVPSLVHRKWCELGREMKKRFREEQELEITSRSFQVHFLPQIQSNDVMISCPSLLFNVFTFPSVCTIQLERIQPTTDYQSRLLRAHGLRQDVLPSSVRSSYDRLLMITRPSA